MNSNQSSLLSAVVLASGLAICCQVAQAADDGRAGSWKSAAQGAPDLAACKRKAQSSPKDAVVQNDLGWALRQNGDLKEAESTLRLAIKLNDGLSQAHSNLSVVLQDQNKAQEAVEEARKAVSLNPDQPIYLVVLGNALAKTEQYDDAITAYNSAIKLRSDYENAYYNLGRVLHLKGKNIDAQNALSQALGLDPKDDRVIELLDRLFKANPPATK